GASIGPRLPVARRLIDLPASPVTTRVRLARPAATDSPRRPSFTSPRCLANFQDGRASRRSIVMASPCRGGLQEPVHDTVRTPAGPQVRQLAAQSTLRQ
ncbi:hypothetical protein FA95DRAFT_1567727, partial [Auriscalpium vulgare]